MSNLDKILKCQLAQQQAWTYFEEHVVRGDGDCGFTALGIARQQLINVLLP